MASKKEKEKRKLVYSDPHERESNREDSTFARYYNIPEGFENWRPKKAGVRRVNIMPYIAGEGNLGANEGELAYEKTVFVHKIGPNDDRVVCLYKTCGERCRVCEEFSKLQRSGVDFNAIKHLRPNERQLFIFHDVTDGYDGPMGIFETSHFKGFGELLKNKLKGDDKKKYRKFMSLTEGKTLKLTLVDDKFDGKSFVKIGDIEFEDRDEQYDEDKIDDIPCLDDEEVVPKPDYDDVAKMFLEGEGKDDKKKAKGDDKPADKKAKGDDKPADKKAAKSKPDEDEEADDEEEDADTDDESDDEEEEMEVEVGSSVEYKDAKTKKRKSGIVKKVNEAKGTLTVEVDGQERDDIVKIDDVTVVSGPSEDDEEEADGEEEEDADTGDDDESEDSKEEEEEEAPKKKGKKPPAKPEPKKKGKPEPEENEDTDDDWDSDDADGDEEEDDDEEEEEEEEEAPPPKKKGQRR